MKPFSELQKKLFDYGPSPETGKVDFKSHYDLFINGEFVRPLSGKYYETLNPATNKPLAKIAWANEADVARAVEAAKRAFASWNQTPPKERAKLLYALARVIQERSRELAIAETLNNGKPIRETRDIDIPLVARHFFYHAGWADKIEGEPIGICGQIVPWNFPLLMAAWKLAPALACGNTVVLKPSETTPISALLLAEILHDIGFPPGVVNIVTGFGDTGSFIVKHPDIAKIAFTGSTEVGKIIRKATAGSGKKLSLELGGKSPTIVFDDAPLHEAVEGIMDSIFFNQGQVCCAGSRLFIQENIAQQFISMLKDRMTKIRVGDPMDKNIDMGAINSRDQLEKIKRYVRTGQEEGAQIWQPQCVCPSEGNFFPPTIFTGVEPTHTIAQEEIFGPVLAIMTFRTPAEAVELANNTPYGLAASVWTKDVSKMVKVARDLRAGTIWGNGTNKFDAAAEFGGYKESGFGREGGVQGLREYLKTESPVENKKPALQTPALNSPLVASASVWKTPKMLIGGKQVRSESGRYYKIHDRTGKTLLANANLGSRKDIRDAVEAAQTALPGWMKTTPYNRGQILYRMAEMLSSRAEEFAQKIVLQTGCEMGPAQEEVKSSIEQLLHYAGWTDKYVGTVNPVTQTDFNITVPEPVGITALIAPNEFPLLGLISKLAPAFAMGNASVIVPSETYPLSATDFIEVLDASDVPSGTINIVTGKHEELAPTLAEHRGVHMMDFSGEPELAKKVEELSVSNLKRVYTNASQNDPRSVLRRYLEFKTVWITSGY